MILMIIWIFAEEFLEYIVQTVLKENANELKVLERDTTKLQNVKRPFPRVHYDEAVEILRKNGIDFKWGNDLGGSDETIVSEQYDRPVMVHHYPAEVKAFYMKRILKILNMHLLWMFLPLKDTKLSAEAKGKITLIFF